MPHCGGWMRLIVFAGESGRKGRRWWRGCGRWGGWWWADACDVWSQPDCDKTRRKTSDCYYWLLRWDAARRVRCRRKMVCVCVYVCLLSECATQQLLNSEKTRVHGQQLITCYLTSAWCIMWCRYLLLLTAECPREEECVRVHVCVWVSDRLYLFSSQFLLVFSLVPSCCFQEAAFRMANGFPGRTPPQFLLGDNGRSAARAWCVCVCVCRFIPLVERPVCVFGEGVYFYFMSLQSWSNRTWEKALLCLDQWLILRLTPWF